MQCTQFMFDLSAVLAGVALGGFIGIMLMKKVFKRVGHGHHYATIVRLESTYDKHNGQYVKVQPKSNTK